MLCEIFAIKMIQREASSEDEAQKKIREQIADAWYVKKKKEKSGVSSPFIYHH